MENVKRYYCGHGEGMFEDNDFGHWVEYSDYLTLHSKLEKARELLKKSRSYFNTKDCFGDIISDIDNYLNRTL